MSNQKPLPLKAGETLPRLRRWSGCLRLIGLTVVLILVSPHIAQFGYCHGWWLTASPWAYYWWLCDCGPEFERSLYPDNIEIVASACLLPREAALSSDGRYMIVGTRSSVESYLIDFVTGEKQSWSYRFSAVSDVQFWTNTFVRVLTDKEKKELIDIVDGSIINLTTFSAHQEGSRLIVPVEALHAFRERKRVVVLDGVNDTVLSLDADPKDQLAKNYVLFYVQDQQEQLMAILEANEIAYQTITLCSLYVGSCPSHDGRFVATSRQIRTSDKYLLTAIQGNPSLNDGIMLIGWAHDDSGVYLQFHPNSHIIDGGFIFPSTYRLPQPIVKLKVPAEYLPAGPEDSARNIHAGDQ